MDRIAISVSHISIAVLMCDKNCDIFAMLLYIIQKVYYPQLLITRW